MSSDSQSLKNKISILGCGWLGRPLALALAAKGFDVKGATRKGENDDKLITGSVVPFSLDISKRDEDLSHFLDSKILIIAVPSKEVEDFQYLEREIAKSSISKVIYISSTSVYPFTNKEVSEEDEVKDCPLATIENVFRNSLHFKTTVVRFAGLIGPGRNPGLFFKSNKVIDQPEGFINLIHLKDCLKIIEGILEMEVWKTTLNACADPHPTKRVFYTQKFKEVGRSKPVFNENSDLKFKIIRNDKLKSILGIDSINLES